MKRLLQCLTCLLVLFGGLGQTVRLLPLGVSITSAATFDLATDWSDAANPNGVWTCREGINSLPHVPYWPYLASPDEQPAWAPSAEPGYNLPAWFQSNSDNPEGLDVLLGDVVVHSTDDSNGISSGVANVIWTSPINGVIDISGAVWMARDIDRSNRWTLLLNEVTLTSGDIFSGDRFNRSKPFVFAKGSGGSKALKRIAISIGDVIELRIEKTSEWGDFVGVNLTITSAATFDLATDWSDAANPKDVWTYREGTEALPYVDNWTPLNSTVDQPAWAPSTVEGNWLPAWFQSTADNPEGLDVLLGDVVVHSTDDSNGISSGVANVIWTSPINGVIDISGAVWMARDIDRSNRWTLLLNEVTLTSGDIFSGDRFNRSKPFVFAKGSGGSKALKRIAISIGDVIELRIERTSEGGDFVGVNLTITEGRGRRWGAGYQDECPNSEKSRNRH